MKLHEYQAKILFLEYGIPTLPFEVVSDAKDVTAAFKKVANPYAMVKVQVLMGGRGKAGGIKKADTAQEAEKTARALLGQWFSTSQSAGEAKRVRSVMISAGIDILEEYYLGIVIDRGQKKPVILFSKAGGIDIEEVAAKKPDAIRKIYFSPEEIPDVATIAERLRPLFAQKDTLEAVASVAAKLCRLFVEKDASICEINPLVLTPDNKIVTLDAKIVFDDNALFRHEELLKLKDPDEEDEREKQAKKYGLSYVSMKGNVGCLVNGAGLAMATMDMIQLAGGEPANFLDVGGGASVEQVKEGFKIILQDERVGAILVNIFGGIMKCDVIAEGVIQASREIKLHVPLVVRLEGTRVEEGRALLKNSRLSILSCSTIQEAAQTAVEKAKTHAYSHR